MFRVLIAAGAGYVLGTKAGRRRYEQISRATKAVLTSPATKTVLDAGRQKLADSLSTEPKMRTLKQIDEETVVYIPERREA
ncbi:hypothetical protein G4X40_17160 [Rhodococcus sp. D2-41]|uniref:YtxH domain-containing protein n=1 Tax=Speluncibacter jeojiensis TaxID=2710754 RepID=A0A9X4RC90_9ACTN|nr:hypothetical protein [Rhodococcus sp. D2-41]MDG3011877.1 hypothetical protein [Rhodococcus sp. D2-41]MDG3013328.1 hypothetical protein [Corynebacteriales bacterium D3-21]